MVREFEGSTFCEIPECNKVWPATGPKIFAKAKAHEGNRSAHLIMRASAVQTDRYAPEVDVVELTMKGPHAIALRQRPGRAAIALANAAIALVRAR